MEQFRIVSWNCRGAAGGSGVWDYLLELKPAVALLQEVGAIPDEVCRQFASHHERAVRTDGTQQAFSTAIMVRGAIGAPITLAGHSASVDADLKRFAGNLVSRVVSLPMGLPLNAVCVYSPAWPIRERLPGADPSGVRLTQNRDFWLTDILWASLKHHAPTPLDLWVVAGDLNLSETFDEWRDGPRGNREWLDRMCALGLVECLRRAQGRLTPTFRNADGGAIKHQMDHMFVTEALASRLISCETGPPERVFGSNLSDHLPLVADFRL